eukprot:7388349-Prymnesium_polylepis.1
MSAQPRQGQSLGAETRATSETKWAKRPTFAMRAISILTSITLVASTKQYMTTTDALGLDVLRKQAYLPSAESITSISSSTATDQSSKPATIKAGPRSIRGCKCKRQKVRVRADVLLSKLSSQTGSPCWRRAAV